MARASGDCPSAAQDSDGWRLASLAPCAAFLHSLRPDLLRAVNAEGRRPAGHTSLAQRAREGFTGTTEGCKPDP